ncbi:MAG: TRAP transporter small permease [Rhodobacteraceae bacterium]|nr:TRAP transporter small permease [Paracoccaceae bacterium]
MIGEAEISLRQQSIWHYIAVAPTWLSALTLFALMIMTFADVVLRSVANNPIESATELTRFFMAIIVFSSLPIVTWKGGHIVVDLMDPLFSSKVARVRDIVIDLLSGVILLWPARRVWELAERARDFGDVTEYLGFPQFIIGWFIAFFTFVTAFVLIVRGLVRIFAPSKVPT